MKRYKESNQDYTTPVPFFVIERAVAGDEDAIHVVLDHFDNYINSLAKQEVINEINEVHEYVNDETKGLLQIHLIEAILKFKIV